MYSYKFIQTYFSFNVSYSDTFEILSMLAEEI